MPYFATRRCVSAAVLVSLVVAVWGLVHAANGRQEAAAQSSGGAASARKDARPRTARAAVAPAVEIVEDLARLPAPVAEMRSAILAAAATGDIAELRTAIEWNELKPDIAAEPVPDPIAHWRRISGDGDGREILAALVDILTLPAVALPQGPDLENNRIYVWPALAELPLASLTPAQEVDLLRLVTPQAARAMKAAGRYTFWRLAIGADGTWHSFRKAE